MNIILLGPPGAGKGTQAVSLAKTIDLPHISTGDIFREAVSAGTHTGLKAKEYMDKGELVPDEIVINIVAERLDKDDTKRGFILDGFPRTLPQAVALEDALKKSNRKIDHAIEINVEDNEIIDRISGRRICRNCGENYHIKYKAPKVDMKCDICGAEVYQRTDDSEETIMRRLQVYRDQTEPLIKYYKDKGSLASIDGLQNIEKVTKDVTAAIQGTA